MEDKRKDHFDSKRHLKRTALKNYRPLTFLPMMWKLLTAQIREEIYDSLIRRELLPKEKKGCRKGTTGTWEQLFIDEHILSECKTRRKNLTMAWIDDKMAYHKVPQSRIIYRLKMYKISGEVMEFIGNTLENWRVELTAGEKRS